MFVGVVLFVDVYFTLCMNRGSKKREEWEYFDDCAICQAMKQAGAAGKELSGKELLDAFGRQNAKHGGQSDRASGE